MRPERAYSPAARASAAPDPSRVLVIGCGALARELVAVIDQAGLTNVDLTCLPATLHNRPGGIPAAVRAKVRAARPRYERIFIAYADCGTGGLLDAMLADEGRRAAARRPLLRVLLGFGGVRRDGRRGARDVLS